MNEARPARFPWWIYWLQLVLILLFALAPVISVIVAGWLAEANGCVLHEGNINPCLIGGADWGGTLYMLFVLGWFALATLPLGGGALIVWLVILIIHRIAWGRMQKVSPQ
ncbi:hypothetical protein NIM87_05325 [Devosia sp. XJ19-1]|uniref:Uncharacterized protein n=1 Tax=Devosia ureilytica TaxID=2952754 RepID=A0A9Q4ANA0_9HYPH|nr:hypothetical protein [Devosia ureilytica]MCP8882911.1 hypothetical protein [Devosia ureilytica]MCP8886721.1 hypothetical protein [Devosia ureilytica]